MYKGLESLTREIFFFIYLLTKSPYKIQKTKKKIVIFFFLAEIIIELYRTNK